MDLDQILETPGAMAWLKMSKRELLKACSGRKPKIPAFKINERVFRFHPKTILSKLAADAGVSPEVIAASFAVGQKVKP